LCKGVGKCGADHLVLATKAGTLGLLELSDVNCAPSPPKEVAFRYAGPPGILGGANFGGTVSGTTFVGIQLNNSTLGEDNLPYVKKNFPPRLDWYPVTDDCYKTITAFKNKQSFLVGYDVRSGEVLWEKAVIPCEEGPEFTSTIANLASNKDLVFVHAGDGKLHVKCVSNGEEVHVIDTEGAGNSHVLLLGNEVYLASGRENYDVGSNANYKATKYLRAWHLCSKSKSCNPCKPVKCCAKKSNCNNKCKPTSCCTVKLNKCCKTNYIKRQ
jgi:hypothetical protein